MYNYDYEITSYETDEEYQNHFLKLFGTNDIMSDDVTKVLEKMIKMKNFKFSTFHFGSGKNYKLKEIIKFINKNYKIKKIISGPGFVPWSNDSVIRGPMVTSNKINFFKPKVNFQTGIKKYINYILKIRNA